MNYLEIPINNLRWKVNDTEPKLYRFKSNKDLAIVNPLYYYGNELQRLVPQHKGHFNRSGNDYLVTSNILLLKLYNNDIDMDTLLNFLRKLLSHIRIHSKQANINPQGSIALIRSHPVFKLEKIKIASKVGGTLILNEFYETHINWGIIRIADLEIKKEKKIPIYKEILVDALNGIFNRDYRKAILYSSISIESLLAIMEFLTISDTKIS